MIDIKKLIPYLAISFLVVSSIAYFYYVSKKIEELERDNKTLKNNIEIERNKAVIEAFSDVNKVERRIHEEKSNAIDSTHFVGKQRL
jgi:Tfp pilus assembly protein PilO